MATAEFEESGVERIVEARVGEWRERDVPQSTTNHIDSGWRRAPQPSRFDHFIPVKDPRDFLELLRHGERIVEATWFDVQPSEPAFPRLVRKK